ncbi:hypothetical protein PIB30_034410 [Stylosanthes scabra]|uniref:Cytidyltransferase-like domain-containing protein n=1 Tax=Stylosanthes scabra TaxID=79078 RepID=A0ABU6ZBE5_9FABA|nr:hypothetical protein [Stylosanthes scabra]
MALEKVTEGCVRMRDAVEAIHSCPYKAVIYVAGGSSQLLGWLLSVPGASNTILEAVVPYSKMSMIQLIGKIPIHWCSQETAQDMALSAYNRALKLSKPGYPAVGVGFTGVMATNRPTSGGHRFYMATRTADRLSISKVTFTKGLHTREEQEAISSQLLLKAIAKACKVSATSVPGLSESFVTEEWEKQFNEDQELEQVINDQILFKFYPFSSEVGAKRKIILPGSFNPLHEGHLKLLEVATRFCGDGYPCFELSALNADKTPLSVSQIKDRVKQFEEVGKTVIISNEPDFHKKAKLFQGSTFVIGADTAERLVNCKYYDGGYKKMLKRLLGCKEAGSTFVVAGRNVDGVFKVVEDFDVPEEVKDMFISIPPELFRMEKRPRS